MYPKRGRVNTTNPYAAPQTRGGQSTLGRSTTARATTPSVRGTTTTTTTTPGRTSGRATSPTATSHRRNLSPVTGSRRSSARCWMCEKVCSARGWNLMPPIREHLSPNSFYAAVDGRDTPGRTQLRAAKHHNDDAPQGEVLTSDFTLCIQCCQAVALPPGTAIAAVITASNSTPSSRIRTHSYISFLREYKMLLEIVAIELGTLDTIEGSAQLIDCIQDTVLTHGAEESGQQQQGHHQWQGGMAGRGGSTQKSLLRPEERSLLLVESAALQHRLDALQRKEKFNDEFYSRQEDRGGHTSSSATVDNNPPYLGRTPRGARTHQAPSRHDLHQEEVGVQEESPSRHNPYHYNYQGPIGGGGGGGGITLRSAGASSRRPFIREEEEEGHNLPKSPSPPKREEREVHLDPYGADAASGSSRRWMKIPLRGTNTAEPPNQHHYTHTPPTSSPRMTSPDRQQRLSAPPGGQHHQPSRNSAHHQLPTSSSLSRSPRRKRTPYLDISSSHSRSSGSAVLLSGEAAEHSVVTQLQEAAAGIQSREAEWEQQRNYYEARIHSLESDLAVAEERLLQREREVIGLKEVNVSLTNKLDQTGGIDRMAAYSKAVTALLATHSNSSAEVVSQKAALFTKEVLQITDRAAKTVVYVEGLERDLQAAQNHLKQQQFAMDSSRRAVLNAWSDAALSPSRQRPHQEQPPAATEGGPPSSTSSSILNKTSTTLDYDGVTFSPSRNPTYFKGSSPVVPNMPSKTTVF